jgi:hypothetical protein
MSTKETGGPAFPCSENGTSHTIAMAAMLQLSETASTEEKDKVYIQTKANAMQGMSLRDYFAAKYMQGAVAGMLASDHDYPNRENMAQYAYLQADAILDARG